MSTPPLSRAVGDFNQMVAELGLDRAEDLADFTGENHFIPFSAWSGSLKKS